MNRHPAALALLSLGLLVPTVACESAAPPSVPATEATQTAPAPAPTKPTGAEGAYEAAMSELEAKHFTRAQAMMDELRQTYPYSKYAALAELRIADADFRQDKPVEAIRGYRQFIHDHRSNSESTFYARAQIAEVMYERAGDLPTGDADKHGALVDAYKELTELIKDYPDRAEVKHFNLLLGNVRDQLGGPPS